METKINFFANLYPLTLIAVILLFFLWQALKVKKKRNGLLNLIIAIAIITYFVSFFANYKLGLFLIVWFIRDLLIFVITMNIYEVALKNKKLLLLFITAVFIVVAIIVNNSIKSPKRVSQLSFEFDNSAELLIDLKDKDQAEKVKELLKEYNAEVFQAFPQLQDIDDTELDDFYTVDITDQSKLADLIAKLKTSGLTDWIEYNEIYKLSPIEKSSSDVATPAKSKFNSLNDPFAKNLWGFDFMDVDNLSASLSKIKPAKKAKIFILDTGVDADHEDIKGNYVSLAKRFDSDTDIHGTHCAGIAGAVSNNKKGIASLNLTGDFTSITSITVLPGGSGTQESIIDGIIVAADNGADVISMSLGGLSSDERQRAYEKAIEYANKKGAIVVVAAGNSNQSALEHVPASCKGVITVAAVDRNLDKAPFSNIVSAIEYKICAPGVDIYSTVPDDKYQSLNGTSMATPYVSGLVGIMKSINPELTTEEVYRILNSTGINTKNTSQTGRFIQPLPALLKVKPSKAASTSEDANFFEKLVTF